MSRANKVQSRARRSRSKADFECHAEGKKAERAKEEREHTQIAESDCARTSKSTTTTRCRESKTPRGRERVIVRECKNKPLRLRQRQMLRNHYKTKLKVMKTLCSQQFITFPAAEKELINRSLYWILLIQGSGSNWFVIVNNSFKYWSFMALVRWAFGFLEFSIRSPFLFFLVFN